MGASISIATPRVADFQLGLTQSGSSSREDSGSVLPTRADSGRLRPTQSRLGLAQGDTDIRAQSREHSETFIATEDLVPRQLAGLEWEILGLLDQTEPLSSTLRNTSRSGRNQRIRTTFRTTSGSHQPRRRGSKYNSTVTIRNDASVRKETVKLVPLKNDEGKELFDLQFVFDAGSRCSIRMGFAPTDINGRDMSSLVSENGEKASVISERFDRGIGQQYTLPEGYCIDVGCLALPKTSVVTATGGDEPYPESDVEGQGGASHGETEGNEGQDDVEGGGGNEPKLVEEVDCMVHLRSHNEHHLDPNTHKDKRGRHRSKSETTYGKLFRDSCGEWNIMVTQQIVDAYDAVYELYEIYGTDGSEECVVCLSAPRDTTPLPCRHLCLCSSCAHELRQHSHTCPVCRASVHIFLRIRTPQSARESICELADDEVPEGNSNPTSPTPAS